MIPLQREILLSSKLQKEWLDNVNVANRGKKTMGKMMMNKLKVKNVNADKSKDRHGSKGRGRDKNKGRQGGRGRSRNRSKSKDKSRHRGGAKGGSNTKDGSGVKSRDKNNSKWRSKDKGRNGSKGKDSSRHRDGAEGGAEAEGNKNRTMRCSKVGCLKGSQHRRQDLVSCDSDSVMGRGVGGACDCVFLSLSSCNMITTPVPTGGPGARTRTRGKMKIFMITRLGGVSR